MGLLAGNLLNGTSNAVSRPSLIVSQTTGKIVHVSGDGTRLLRNTEDAIIGRDIREIMEVEIPPRLGNAKRLRKRLWEEGSWLGRASIPGLFGKRIYQLRWRSVPMGWASYWLLTFEETHKQTEDPLTHGLLDNTNTVIEPSFRLVDHPVSTEDQWQLTSFHRPVGTNGGDVLFFEEAGNDYLLYFLGDVAGHHRGAALVRLMLTTYLRIYREEFNTSNAGYFPGMLLSRMNNALAQDVHNDCLLTAVVLVLEKRGNRIFYASAGHQPVFLVRPGRAREVVTSEDIPLGIRSRRRYRSIEIKTSPGDRLLCYTDGLITSGSPANHTSGLRSLLTTLESYEDSTVDELAGRIQRLWSAAENKSNTFEDDVTFSVIAHRSHESGSLSGRLPN